MIGEGVLAAMTGAGHVNREGTAGVCDGGREFWIAGDAFAETGWLAGGEVDVAACATPEGGADADVVGAGVSSSSSGPWVVSRRRFRPREELALSPKAVALIRI